MSGEDGRERSPRPVVTLFDDDTVGLSQPYVDGPALSEDLIEFNCEEFLAGQLALPVQFVPDIAAYALRQLKARPQRGRGRPPGKPARAAEFVDNLMTYTGLGQDKARARAARAYRLDRKTVAEAHRRLLGKKALEKSARFMRRSPDKSG
jgi:hypothetical protein